MDRFRLGTRVAHQAGPVDTQARLEGMSLIMASERGIVELYRRYSAETLDTTLQKQWQTFGAKAQVHVQITEGVIAANQGNAGYRSPAALEVERCAQAMLNLSAQGEQADLIRLSHLVSMEQVSISYWKGVDGVAAQTKDPSLAQILRKAASTIQRDKQQHLNWNINMLHRYVEKVMTGR